MPNLPELIAALSFFGLTVVCPLVYLMMRHQRYLAEMMHRTPANELLERLEAIERELREVRRTQVTQVLDAEEAKQLTRSVV